MDNAVIVGIYFPFVLLTTVIFFSGFSRYLKTRMDLMFTLLCFCMLGWFACEILTLTVEAIPVHSILWNLNHIFVGFIPPLMFLFMQKFFNPSYTPSPVTVFFLFLIPVDNIIMVLTSGSHKLIRQINVVSTRPILHIESLWGPWFWVYIGYCFTLSLAITAVIIIEHFRMPKFYRLASAMMVLGIALVLASSVAVFLDLVPSVPDFTAIAGSASLLFIHLAMIGNNQSIFVRFARGQVFRHLDDLILVLGENDQVADFNPGANRWFSTLGIDLDSYTLQGVITALKEKGVSVTEWAARKNGLDLSMNQGHYPVVLNFRMHDLTDDKGQKVGSIAIFSDVSENRALIERLEAKAGMDPLTGLANRLAYEGAKKRLDSPEHLPLSCVMCDINGLKAVNDSLGHPYGDMMMRVVAEALEKLCPKSSFLARVGGDEFIYLMPHTDMDVARELMKRIRIALSSADNLPFYVSASVGAAVKHSSQESIDDIIALADSRMYYQKKQMKRYRHSQPIRSILVTPPS